MPILSGEWGYSNVNWDGSRLTDEQQTRYLTRMFLLNKAANMKVSIWYDWSNDGADPDEREHNFGTVEQNLEPKLPYSAARTLNHCLAGYVVTDRSVKKNDVYQVELVKQGHKAMALWTTGSKQAVNLDLEPGRGRVVDMLGNSREVSWREGLKLEVSPSPQHVLID